MTDTASFTVAFLSIAQLLVVVAGLCVMFGAKRYAGRMMGLAILAVVVAVYGPSWLPA
jgi:uncharacterized membrane protein